MLVLLQLLNQIVAPDHRLHHHHHHRRHHDHDCRRSQWVTSAVCSCPRLYLHPHVRSSVHTHFRIQSQSFRQIVVSVSDRCSSIWTSSSPCPRCRPCPQSMTLSFPIWLLPFATSRSGVRRWMRMRSERRTPLPAPQSSMRMSFVQQWPSCLKSVRVKSGDGRSCCCWWQR